MKTDVVVKEYVKGLSDNELTFLGARFKQNLCGDKEEIIRKLSENKDVDQWLATSSSANEFFDMLDVVGECISAEYSYRFDDERRQKKKFRRD